ncbi:lipoxygenase homology domain-containing protein 1-like [Lampetra planeri]
MLYHLVMVLSLVALTRGAESGDWSYNVTVYTGTETGAGTDANVRIWIYGDDVAENIILNHSTRNKDAFENGQVDEFLVKLHPLGRIKSIIVGNDGSQSFPCWSFKQLVIKERSSGCTTMFVCECWINDGNETLYPKEVTSCETETNHTATTDVTTVFIKGRR